MVFRGKPSKACERCRARRLKCDLQIGTCGQCVRANVPCSGYRDTQQLRIQNESQSVVRKALQNAPPFKLRSLPLSIDLQARGVFFNFYVTGTCWDFLREYYHPSDSPDHLTVAIEAVSLAYLWHQVNSHAALAAARERYVLALRMTNKALKSSEATKDTTLLASLLLDLFEKITDSKPRNNKSWTSHINGALVLVSLRGLKHFQDPLELRIILRLTSHYVVNCVASDLPVPDELIAIQAYVAKRLNFQEPMVGLSGLMVQYANLLSGRRNVILSDEKYIEASMELDVKMQVLDVDLPPYWQYTTTLLEHKSDRAFDLHFDTYASRSVCQARNVVRLIRILLNESMIEHYSVSSTDLALIRVAHENIETLAGEICACVPQFVDCDGAARQRLPASERLEIRGCTLDCGLLRADHTHTPDHQTDCYSLIFPLYAAGRNKAVPNVRPWVIKQLHHISCHFNIRNAEVVAQILERDIDVCPWEVYAMLGSYAFV